jgi:glycyl-tRNA synthetase alpha subunit
MSTAYGAVIAASDAERSALFAAAARRLGSRRERPIGHPAYEHVAKCSHCYREFRALQQAAQGHRHTFTRHRRLLQRLGWRSR